MKAPVWSKFLVAVFAVAGITVVQFALISEAQARSPHCSAIPVPGQPGHFIVRCSTQRP